MSIINGVWSVRACVNVVQCIKVRGRQAQHKLDRVITPFIRSIQ